MAKEYGQRPSEFLLGLAGQYRTDLAVWNAAVPIENALAGAKDATQQKAILARLERDVEAERRELDVPTAALCRQRRRVGCQATKGRVPGGA